jgi:hypothetical protein
VRGETILRGLEEAEKTINRFQSFCHGYVESLRSNPIERTAEPVVTPLGRLIGTIQPVLLNSS